MLALSNTLLEDIAMALQDSSYEMDWYLDLKKEATTFLGDPAVTGEHEAHRKLKQQIEQNEERFVAIPRGSSREGWTQMKRFILSLDDQDDKIQNLLLTNIQGKGAFRRFKDALIDIGLIDRWYEFKNREDRKRALKWLHGEGLIAQSDIEKGMKLFEKQLKERKQRKEELRNMTKGTQVKCQVASPHEDKLTIGKTYQALDEQKQHKNIRIRDDRGKLVWLGKNHFKLTD